jgi:hypothetical protein
MRAMDQPSIARGMTLLGTESAPMPGACCSIGEDAPLARAVALDSEFAAAHAQIASVEKALCDHNDDDCEARRSRAWRALERALELDPELPAAHHVRAMMPRRGRRVARPRKASPTRSASRRAPPPVSPAPSGSRSDSSGPRRSRAAPARRSWCPAESSGPRGSSGPDSGAPATALKVADHAAWWHAISIAQSENLIPIAFTW